MIPLFKAWGFVSSPIGRALRVGLIAVVALGYAYMKGEESGRTGGGRGPRGHSQRKAQHL